MVVERSFVLLCVFLHGDGGFPSRSASRSESSSERCSAAFNPCPRPRQGGGPPTALCVKPRSNDGVGGHPDLQLMLHDTRQQVARSARTARVVASSYYLHPRPPSRGIALTCVRHTTYRIQLMRMLVSPASTSWRGRGSIASDLAWHHFCYCYGFTYTLLSLLLPLKWGVRRLFHDCTLGLV